MNSSAQAPVRILPACCQGFTPRSTVLPLASSFKQLGANAVYMGVTADETLYHKPGVEEAMRLWTESGFELYVGWWAAFGLFGGEAAYPEMIAKLRGESFIAVHNVNQFGPWAEATPPGEDLSPHIGREWAWLCEAARRNGARGIIFDEPKIEGLYRFDGWVMPRALVGQMVEYARSLRLETIFIIADTTVLGSSAQSGDRALMKWLVEEGLADVIGTTRYHALGTYDRVDPEVYIGEGCDYIRSLLPPSGHQQRYWATVQGFDLQGREDVIIRNAEIARRHGICDGLFVWGGPFVDQQPDYENGDRLPRAGRYNRAITRALQGHATKSDLCRRVAAPPNSLTVALS